MDIKDTGEVNPNQGDLQLATFYIGDLVLGLQISQVQEINRRLDLTRVPHSPEYVRGVINLRGEVVTVIDLRRALGMPPVEVSKSTRNLIVNFDGEAVGLCVDKISDIIAVPEDSLSPPPSNMSDVEGKFFTGVYTAESDIIAILNIHEALSLAA